MTVPSAWSASAGVLHQTSNIHDGDVAAATLSKLGSSVWWAAGLGWMDYTLQLTLRAGDDDALGVMFRYQETGNYYRFSWEQQRSYRRLVKRTNGVVTLLAEVAVPYTQGTTYTVDIVAMGGSLEVRINGVPLWGGGDRR